MKKKPALSTPSKVSSNWLNVVGPKCTAWPPTGGDSFKIVRYSKTI